MSFQKVIIIVLSAVLCLGLFDTAFAGTKTKKSRSRARTTLEVYSAMEEPEALDSIAPIATVSEIQLPSQITTLTNQTDLYFSVPNHQTDLIASRLRIVEAILIECNRAYDYRSHTTSELKAILKEIRAQKAAKRMLAE